MGHYAAHCMASTAEAPALAFSFELFTHVTRFLGMKVTFLGLYDGQKIPDSKAEHLVSYSRCVEVVHFFPAPAPFNGRILCDTIRVAWPAALFC